MGVVCNRDYRRMLDRVNRGYPATKQRDSHNKQSVRAFMHSQNSFVYTIKRSEDEIEERVFTSHYRPLPKICLLGVTEEELAAGDQEVPDDAVFREFPDWYYQE